jgi:poly-D-alanine transfer protein DltD
LKEKSEKIRKTRKAQPDSFDGSEVKELDVAEGDKFNFENHSPVQFKFLDVSITKDKNVDKLFEEISKSLQ